MAVIAKLLPVSRQSLDVTPKVPRTDTGERVRLRLVTPVLPEEWATMHLGPELVDLYVAICAPRCRLPQGHLPPAPAWLPGELQARGQIAPGLGVHPSPEEAPPQGPGPPVSHLCSERAVADRHDERGCDGHAWSSLSAIIDCFD